MLMDFFRWDIEGPLKSHPLKGAIVGAVTGLIFATLAALGGAQVPQSRLVLGYGLSGTVGGGIIGIFLPLFKNRIAAGFVVGVAISTAFVVLHWIWGDGMPPEGSIFLGVLMGFMYALLMWSYRTRQ